MESKRKWVRASIINGTKLCNVCTQRLALEHFHRMAASPDGFVYTCKSCTRTIQREDFHHRSPERRRKLNKYSRTKYREFRNRVIDHYGGGCACCGETNRGFLTIDHVKNDGAAERKQGIGLLQLVRLIVKQGYPSNYQILCYNCNLGRAYNYSICPHKVSESTHV